MSDLLNIASLFSRQNLFGGFSPSFPLMKAEGMPQAMITVVVHLFVTPGMTEQFDAYEHQALQILAGYDGELVSIVRPNPEYSSAPCPNEIHVIRIASLERFQDFRRDAQLAALADLRSQAILRTEIFIGYEDDGNALQ